LFGSTKFPSGDTTQQSSKFKSFKAEKSKKNANIFSAIKLQLLILTNSRESTAISQSPSPLISPIKPTKNNPLRRFLSFKEEHALSVISHLSNVKSSKELGILEKKASSIWPQESNIKTAIGSPFNSVKSAPLSPCALKITNFF